MSNEKNCYRHDVEPSKLKKMVFLNWNEVSKIVLVVVYFKYFTFTNMNQLKISLTNLLLIYALQIWIYYLECEFSVYLIKNNKWKWFTIRATLLLLVVSQHTVSIRMKKLGYWIYE